MKIRFWDLGNRDVINCRNGKKIGHIGDVELDMEDFSLVSICVPIGKKCGGCFGKKEEYIIPVECIVKVGVDIVLVDIDEKKCLGK